MLNLTISRPSARQARAVAVALAVIASATALSACEAGTSTAPDAAANPWRVDGEITLVPFSDVTTETCLGDYLLEGGLLQTTECSTPGAMQVVGITTFGESAPAERPTNAEMMTLAGHECAAAFAAWADSTPTEAAPTQLLTYPDEWSGPATPLVCASAS